MAASSHDQNQPQPGDDRSQKHQPGFNAHSDFDRDDDDASSHPETDLTVIEPTSSSAAERVESTRELPREFGDFRLLKILGTGGMGTVFEANERSLNRRVAVKVMKQNSDRDGIQRIRFLNESNVVAQMDHPNIGEVYRVGELGGECYFSMKLIEGHDLRTVLARIREETSTDRQKRNPSASSQRKTATTPRLNDSTRPGQTSRSNQDDSASAGSSSLSADGYLAASSRKAGRRSVAGYFQSVARVGAAAASAIQHAHSKGVLHRDIKPANLMVDGDGHVWVMDFGLAHVQSNEPITKTDDVLGTYRYMSPEQASGRHGFVDHRTDVYSLGVTLYEMLTLEKAVEGKSTEEILKHLCFKHPIRVSARNPAVPLDLRTIVEKAIERDPIDRYDSAEEMETDLRHFLNGQPIAARKPSLSRRFARWIQSNRQLAVATASIVLILMLTSIAIAGVVYQGMLTERDNRRATQKALVVSEGRRVLSLSALQLDRNPGLSLALAREGAARISGPEVSETLQRAIDKNQELKTLRTDRQFRFSAVNHAGTFSVHSPFGDEQQFSDGRLVVSDLESQKVVSTLELGSQIWSLIFSPDDRWLLVGCVRPEDNQQVPVLISTQDWTAVQRFPDHRIALTLLDDSRSNAFSLNGRSLILCHESGAADVIRLADQKTVTRLQDENQQSTLAALSSDGQTAVTLSKKGQVVRWDTSTGRPMQAMSVLTTVQPAMGLHLIARHIVVRGLRSTEFFSTDEPEAAPVRRSENFFACSKEDSVIYMATISSDSVVVMDDRTLQERQNLRVAGRILGLEADRGLIVVPVYADESYRTNVYSFPDLQQIGELKGHTSKAICLRVSADKQRIVTSGEDKTIRTWSTDNGRIQRRFGKRFTSSNCSFRISADGSRIAVIPPPAQESQIINAAGKPTGRQLPGAFHPGNVDVTRMIVTHEGNTAYAHMTQGPASLKSMPFQSRLVEAKAIAARPLVVARSENGEAWLWNVETNRVHEFTDANNCQFVEASGSGRYVAVGDPQGKVLVWDLQSDAPIQILQQQGDLTALAVGDSRIVTASRTGKIFIWNIADGTLLATLKSNATNTNHLKLLNNDQVLLSSDVTSRSVARLWSMETFQPVKDLSERQLYYVHQHPEKPLALLVSIREKALLCDLNDFTLTEIGDDVAEHACFSQDSIAVVTAQDSEQPFGPAVLQFFDLQGKKQASAINFDVVPASIVGVQGTDQIAVSEYVAGCEVFDFQTMQRLYDLKIPGIKVRHLSFKGPTNELIAVGFHGTAFHFSDTGTLLKSVPMDLPGVKQIAASLDGRLLLLASPNGEVRVVSTDDFEVKKTVPGNDMPIHSLLLSNDSRLITAAKNGNVRVHDLRTGVERSLQSDARILATDVSPDGESVLLLEQQTAPAEAKMQARPIRAVVVAIATSARQQIPIAKATVARFSADGKVIGILDQDGALHCLDSSSFQSIVKIDLQGNRIQLFAFHPDQPSVLTWQRDGLAVWSLVDGKEKYRATYKSPRSALTLTQAATRWNPWNGPFNSFMTSGAEVLKWDQDIVQKADTLPIRRLTESERLRFQLSSETLAPD